MTNSLDPSCDGVFSEEKDREVRIEHADPYSIR
jgi:hypothetical protein